MKRTLNFLGTALLAGSLVLPQVALAQNFPIKGWGGGNSAGPNTNNYEFGVEQMGATKSAFVAAKSATPTGFGTLTQGMSAEEYRGKRLRMSARVKTADAGSAQLWMRVDAQPQKVLAFDNMDSRPVTGTTDWKRYEVVLDVPQDAAVIVFGVFLNGKGKLWADDFQFETVGTDVPVTGTLPLRRVPTNLNFDQ